MRVKKLFDQCADTYDQDRRKLIPCFDEFYGAVLRVIPFQKGDNVQVLDMGAGTGILSDMISRKLPDARILLSDISESMLNQARQRFAGNPLISFSVQDHLSLEAEAQYGLVVSALSIHHLAHSDKQLLFRKIYSALKPGGMFIHADQALAPTASGEDLHQAIWLDEVRASGIGEPALQQAMERVRLDNNALLSHQIAWMHEAGFEEVDCWFKWFRFVVYGGRKGRDA